MGVEGFTRCVRPTAAEGDAVSPIVETESGRLEGRQRAAGGRQIVEFHGIPYAAPPVGPLRFRAPQPLAGWTGTRDAQRFGPAPMQSLSSPFSGVIPGNSVESADEDCLT